MIEQEELERLARFVGRSQDALSQAAHARGYALGMNARADEINDLRRRLAVAESRIQIMEQREAGASIPAPAPGN